MGITLLMVRVQLVDFGANFLAPEHVPAAFLAFGVIMVPSKTLIKTFLAPTMAQLMNIIGGRTEQYAKKSQNKTKQKVCPYLIYFAFACFSLNIFGACQQLESLKCFSCCVIASCNKQFYASIHVRKQPNKPNKKKTCFLFLFPSDHFSFNTY